MERDQTDSVMWGEQGVPVSVRFDDPYYSLENGLAETCHVFLDGNDLPARFQPGFHIAELGFGTGLNLIAALRAWPTAGTHGPLRFTSFEAFPMAPEDAARALAGFPEAAPFADIVAEALADPATPLMRPDLELRLALGAARQTLPGQESRTVAARPAGRGRQAAGARRHIRHLHGGGPCPTRPCRCRVRRGPRAGLWPQATHERGAAERWAMTRDWASP